MSEITILVQNELRYYLELFHILSKIYFYFNNINIHCNEEYFSINSIIYNNLFNVNLINNTNIDESNNIIHFENSQKFINQINIFNFNINNNFYTKLNRDILQENVLYMKLVENISNKYVFYFSYNSNKIINYFENLYIYNPITEFYDEDDDYFGKWLDLETNNISYYLKIIENASELHIYDIDMLFLILEIDVSHISKKYFYYNDVLIKEEDNRLKDWTIIIY